MELRPALRQVRDRVGTRWQRARHGQRTLVLGYHRVAELDPDPFHLAVSPAHFEEHLEVLRAYGRPVLFAEIGQRQDADEQVCITFDDGYADNFHTARPLLEKHDVPWTLFVATGQIGSGREFWWDQIGQILDRPGATVADLIELRGALYDASPAEREVKLKTALGDAAGGPMRNTHAVMSADELLALAASPLVEIGAHTQTHPNLTALPPEEQRSEIAGSKQWLERLIGRPVTSFAYPFGAWSRTTAELVREAGFLRAATTEEGCASQYSDPYATPRMLVGDCSGENLGRALRKWFGRSPAGPRFG